MSNNRDIKSRKNTSSNAKNSLIDKVNSPSRPEPQKLASDNSERKTKETKFNNNTSNKKKPSKQGKSFFFKLSKIGQIMFIIYIALMIIVIGLFVRSLVSKGSPQMGSRNEPIKVITKEDVKKVKEAIEKDVPAEKVDVQLTAYRLVVVLDLSDSTNAADGKKANYRTYGIINQILPIKEYFSSATELNNDLFIYSTDVVPNNFETNSKYIFQTYKNSKMNKPLSYDLLQPRDEKSQKEVLDTFKKATGN